MKANPYAGSQVVLKNGAPVTDFRMPGTQVPGIIHFSWTRMNKVSI